MFIDSCPFDSDLPLTFSTEPPFDANVISFTFAPKTEEIEAHPASTVDAAYEIGDVNTAAAANEVEPADVRDAENAATAVDPPSEDYKAEMEMAFEPHLSPPDVESKFKQLID